MESRRVFFVAHLGVSKNKGTPQMDGENNGRPY